MSSTMNREKSAGEPRERPAEPAQKAGGAWADRVRALGNVPPVLKILWESGPQIVTWGLILRVIFAAIPWGLARIAAWIVQGVEQVIRHQGMRPHFWKMVGLEVALAVLTAAVGRLIDYCDSLLADRYTHHVSIKVMRQAAQLDLTTYEDPAYYDRLERARVQATDRLAMIQQMGRLFQQVLTTLIFTGTLLFYSPWLVLLLCIGVIPSFVGETHFAFLGYAKNFRQTPAKRQMDYLRQVGGSKEAAKELKLFNLSEYLSGRFAALSQSIYEENVALSRRKLFWGGLLSMLGILGYYGAYAYVIWRAVQGQYALETFVFITAAIQQASSNLQQVFSTASGIADQALFLTDLLAFFAMQPTVQSKPGALPAPRPITRGFEFRNVSFTYPGTSRRILSNFNFTLSPGERVALIGENGQGKTTIVKLITRLYDPSEGQVLLDGVDLREYELEKLHAEIGVIFQDFMRYEMTARENIAVGRIEQEHAQEEIEYAAEKSLASGVIAKLHGRYDQMLGRRFEGGVDL
jgi:ATP-binding cassette, subfamily B, bacterial